MQKAHLVLVYMGVAAEARNSNRWVRIWAGQEYLYVALGTSILSLTSLYDGSQADGVMIWRD